MASAWIGGGKVREFPQYLRWSTQIVKIEGAMSDKAKSDGEIIEGAGEECGG